MVFTYYFGDDDFDYEVEVSDKVKFECLADYYDTSVEMIKKINDDFEFDDNIFCDMFEDELKHIYEDEAYDAYKDSKLYNKDPMGYYGVKQKDFI